jgi:hypothetical protein
MWRSGGRNESVTKQHENGENTAVLGGIRINDLKVRAAETIC